MKVAWEILLHISSGFIHLIFIAMLKQCDNGTRDLELS